MQQLQQHFNTRFHKMNVETLAQASKAMYYIVYHKATVTMPNLEDALVLFYSLEAMGYTPEMRKIGQDYQIR